MLAAQGIGEAAARGFLGSLVSDYDDGYVAVVLDRAWLRRETLVDVRSAIRATLKRYPTREAERLAAKNRKEGRAERPTGRPLATPEFLNISPGMARKIQERNRALQDFRFDRPKAATPGGEEAGRKQDPSAQAARSTTVDADGGNE
jgi:hypothetical protein